MEVSEFLKRCTDNNYSCRITYYSTSSSYHVEMGKDEKMHSEAGKNLDMILLLCWSVFVQDVMPPNTTST